ncbi:hypothetical protein AMAG_09986 [Allomyces macrogynus ATCC 38327]|uniref:Uncharacterized protein n=1 Tax=Allomyces macrogynus (strain ATCC 38327) TaxID=578462 RepID=A0A0L0SQK2_ALLM3|nr:hypothetical protein AMAG_09986 [Allomyces macrogynus ATCC 38327]|eukprot:KNE64630.1 hypothetical protein AMAG_09986 [Allomyces macrogynus ATCC 38327]
MPFSRMNRWQSHSCIPCRHCNPRSHPVLSRPTSRAAMSDSNSSNSNIIYSTDSALTVVDSSTQPPTPASLPTLPVELIEEILVQFVVVHYSRTPTSHLLRGSGDDAVERELRQYLLVTRNLMLLQRAVLVRFPGCAVHIAVAEGRLDRLRARFAIDSVVDLDSVSKSGALELACERGDVAVLQWLLDHTNSKRTLLLMRPFSKVALVAAAVRNDLSFCDWWFGRIERFAVRGTMAAALDAAAEHGHMVVLEWWLHTGFPFTKLASRFVRPASARGRVDVLEWMVQAGLPIRYCNDAMDYASANGHIDVLEWWRDAGARPRRLVRSLPYQAPMCKASANGHIHILDWWWGLLGGKLSDQDRDYGVVAASKHGQLDALDWWFAKEECLPGRSTVAMNWALNGALYNNHVAVLERWKRRVVESHATVLENAQYVDQTTNASPFPPPSWWVDCGFVCNHWPTTADMAKASEKGSIDAMRWWIAHKLPFIHTPRGINSASANGEVAVLDWWLHESGLEPLYTIWAIAGASLGGHVAVLDWWRQSGLPLKYTHDARVRGLASDKKGVAAWWSADDLPPSAPFSNEWPFRLVNAIKK